MCQQMLIHDLHDLDILRFFSYWLIVQPASMHLQQFALPAHRNSLQSRLNEQSAGLHIPSLAQVFFKNSFSTFNWPICAYNAWVSTSSFSAAPFFSKAAAIFSRNSAFHLEIITGLTSNLTASSASVC